MGSLSKVDISMERTSAHIIIEKVLDWIHPKEVIQLGCGEGIWLQEFKSRGIAINGVDLEDYARSTFWQENPSGFLAADLRQQIVSSPDRLDLAISLETANKLEEDKAREFVRSLCNLSDVVLFSAAVPGQNEDDVNAQMQSYWGEIFKENNYVALDCIRLKVWDNEQVDVRYRQNLMLYVKEIALAQYPLLFEYYAKHREYMVSNMVHPVFLRQQKEILEQKIEDMRPKKILYTFFHNGAFGWVLIHRLIRHQKDEAYLLLADGSPWWSGGPQYRDVYQRLIDYGFFKQIYTYDDRLGKDPNVYATMENAEQGILNGIDAALKKQECDLYSFDEIYSGIDFEDTIGAYLGMKNIHFKYFEMGPIISMLAKPEVNPLIKSRPAYRDVLMKYSPFYNKKKQCYVLFSYEEATDIPKDNIEIFDPNQEACSISKYDRDRIIYLFKLWEVPHEGKLTWIFLQSTGWAYVFQYPGLKLVQENFKSGHEFYCACIQTVMDYYLPDGTIPVLKPHPSDILSDEIQKKYFGGVYTFHNLFTVPLIKILPEEYLPEYVVLSGNSAPKQIGNNLKKIDCTGVFLFSVFFQKYIVVLILLDYMDFLYKQVGERFKNIGPKGDTLGYNTKYLSSDINNMVKVKFANAINECNVDYAVIQTNPSELDKEFDNRDFIIYTDVWSEVTVQQLEEIRGKANVIIVKISKEPLKDLEDIIVPLDNEYVFLISKENSYVKKMENFYVSRKNKTMGIELIAQNISWEDYLGECKNS